MTDTERNNADTQVTTDEQQRLVAQGAQLPGVAEALRVFRDASARAPLTPPSQPLVTTSTTTNVFRQGGGSHAMTEGVDYSYSHPNLAQLRAAGKTFVVRYVGGKGPPHDLTAAEVRDITGAGLHLCVVFENGAGRARGGYSQGVVDGRYSAHAVDSLGIPGCPVYAAVDFDVTAADLPAAREYVRGFATGIGRDQAGVYGDPDILNAARDLRLCRYFWQAAGWAYGHQVTGAHLRQHAPSINLAGGEVDLNTAYTADYGQWPRPQEDDMPYTETQLRTIVSEEVAKAVESQHVRDTIAGSVLWWLAAALHGNTPDMPKEWTDDAARDAAKAIRDALAK